MIKLLLFCSPEEHIEPVLLQIVIVVGPAGLEVLVPGLVRVDLLARVHPVHQRKDEFKCRR